MASDVHDAVGSIDGHFTGTYLTSMYYFLYVADYIYIYAAL